MGKATVTITVAEPDNPPTATAGATGARTGQVPFTANLTGSGTDDGTIQYYEWDFDGDGAYDWVSRPGVDTNGNTSYTYREIGTYIATLRVTDNDGIYATDTVTLSKALAHDLELVDYVMYHELLHKKHKFTSKNGKSRHHTKEFRIAEKRYPNQELMEKR